MVYELFNEAEGYIMQA